MPYDIEKVIGLKARQDLEAGQELRWTSLGE
jgi:sialic acid synthase SpsE